MIEQCSQVDQPGWLGLRRLLWSDCTSEEHRTEMASALAQPERFIQFVAYGESMQPIGLAEASIRHDYVNGTESSPVAFLEGVFVVPSHRRQGIARQLIANIVGWAIARGCLELASDAPVENEPSHALHAALGFTETERVVFFRQSLRR